jgi:hypothetical protein
MLAIAIGAAFTARAAPPTPARPERRPRTDRLLTWYVRE